MTISNELLDELLRGCERPEDLLGDAGLMTVLKVRLMERMLGAELSAHLGYEAGAEPPPEQADRRDGIATKRVKGSDGEVTSGSRAGRRCSSTAVGQAVPTAGAARAVAGRASVRTASRVSSGRTEPQAGAGSGRPLIQVNLPASRYGFLPQPQAWRSIGRHYPERIGKNIRSRQMFKH